MEILDYFPIILTKDSNWTKRKVVAKEGAIILLPQDAILVKPKETEHGSK